MHAYETRVSRAFRGMDGGADSHDVLNPPDAAGPVEVLCGVDERVVQCAIAPADGNPTAPMLSEAQLDAFWAGIVANLDAARRMAARFVSSQSVEDVVHTAAQLFVEDAKRSKKPEPFPASAERFRRTFLRMVRNHALDCVRDSRRPACPVHSHWGIDPEPFIAGRNVADRELDTIFARNDDGKYDAPAPTVRRAKDDLNGLHYILRAHLEDLSQTQREILLEAYFEEQSPDEIAARRGITLNTYHNHRKAAFTKLRESMMAVADFSSDIDLPDWYDRVEEMNKRHAARQRRRSARKKENRSNSGGDRSNFDGDASNSRRDA
jgi:RNA polymerase sigma factor (sigma-70 family)